MKSTAHSSTNRGCRQQLSRITATGRGMVLGMLFPVLVGAAIAPAPSITALQSDISLSESDGVTIANVVLVGKGANMTPDLPPTISLPDAIGDEKVKVTTIEELSSGAAGKVWQVRLNVDGLYPGEPTPVVLVARHGDGGPFAIPVKLIAPPVSGPTWRLLRSASRWLINRKLGLPAAGSKLQQLTPASTRTLFRVSVPKAKG